MAHSGDVSTSSDMNHDGQRTWRPPSSVPLAVRARPEVMRIPKLPEHGVIPGDDPSNAERSNFGFEDSKMTDTAPTSSNAVLRKGSESFEMSTIFSNMWNYINTLQLRLNLLFESPTLLMFSVFQSITDYFTSTTPPPTPPTTTPTTTTPTTDTSTSTTTPPDERPESEREHTTNAGDDNVDGTVEAVHDTIQGGEVETTPHEHVEDDDVQWADDDVQWADEGVMHDDTMIYDTIEDTNHGIPPSDFELPGEDDEPCPLDLSESPRQLSINHTHHIEHGHECTSELSREDCESVNTMLSFSTMDKSASFLARRPRSKSMRERLRKVKRNVRKSFYSATCWKPGNSSYN